MTEGLRITLLGFLFAGRLFAAEESSNGAIALIQEGVRLHDEGKYDEAIAKYRQALEVDPGNVDAHYEISYALFAAGRYEECIDEIEPHLERAGQLKPFFYVNLGNCNNMAGHSRKARRWYERGMKEFPTNASLPFNAAIRAMGEEDWAEARKLLKRALELDPLHRSSHLNLGVAFETGGYNVQALLAFLRFLSLEPEGPRAKEAAARTFGILGAGLTKTGETEYHVTISTKAPKDEGDYSGADLIRVLGAAVVETEEWQGKSEGEKLVHRIDSVVATVDEEPEGQTARDFTRATYLPFASALREAALLETFVYRIFAPIGPPEFQAWLDQHPEQVALLEGFLRSQAKP